MRFAGDPLSFKDPRLKEESPMALPLAATPERMRLVESSRAGVLHKALRTSCVTS